MTLDARMRIDVGGFRLEAALALDAGVLVLFGPSGAGKTLTVAALAGLVRPTEGVVRVGDRVLFDAGAGVGGGGARARGGGGGPPPPPGARGGAGGGGGLPGGGGSGGGAGGWGAGGGGGPARPRGRRLGYVPQHHSLFPFLNVAENVAFGLPRERRRDDPTVAALMEELELTHLAQARPASLSGGERQRVAVARALAVEPDLLLLDEPFASIDRAGRRRARAVVARVLEAHGTPAVLVTHDAAEALELGTRVVLYERGRTTRSGTPSEVLPSTVRLTATLGPDGTLEGARLEGDVARLEGDVDVTFTLP